MMVLILDIPNVVDSRMDDDTGVGEGVLLKHGPVHRHRDRRTCRLCVEGYVPMCGIL